MYIAQQKFMATLEKIVFHTQMIVVCDLFSAFGLNTVMNRFQHSADIWLGPQIQHNGNYILKLLL
jgi:hypothetical protein